MANLNTLDLNNKPSGQIELNDQILETKYHPQAIKQAVVGFLAANRQGTHSTKTRAEVSYSTKKLYRQKGTGNARSSYTSSRRNNFWSFSKRLFDQVQQKIPEVSFAIGHCRKNPTKPIGDS